MSLRTQLTMTFAFLMILIVTVSGFLAVGSAERNLIDEVDDFLENRVTGLVNLASGPDSKRQLEQNLAQLKASDRFVPEPDSIVQIVNVNGKAIVAYPFKLPIGESEKRLAIEKSDFSRLTNARTVEIGEVEYRLISRSLRGGGVVQVARNLSEVNDAVSGMIRNFIFIGLAGLVLVILLGWFLASRLTKPISNLSKAAEHVAETQDLQAFIDPEVGDLEVKALANSFNVMLEALSTSREQQRRLVADASHELRTPLTSLRTNIEILSRTQSLDEKERNLIIADLRREIEELSILVEEIVDLAIATSHAKEEFEDVDLSDVAREVVEKYIRRSGRVIALSSVGKSVRYIQRSSIDRAISNLIDNAIKFSPETSEIFVNIQDGRISVRDFGSGILDSDKPRLFDRFYRSLETRNLPGSGLGLSIVYEIVQGHGGEVFIEKPDTGPGAIVGFLI
ncbi:MAG: HAMP domain-containing protein [Acidimicrobiales bacterium]|nr:HAMP domain-containing protein [Acidimicrobiales bacterium]